MKLDISTTLSTYLDRVVDDLLHGIAKDGLVLLKRILDEAGFSKSPFLKDYQVFSHIVGDVVVFEVLLDIESVVAADPMTQQAIDGSRDGAEQDEAAASVSFGLGPGGPQRLVSKTNALRNARRPAVDARRPARDARENAIDRLVKKEIANVTPRSMNIDREGRLSIALKRSTRAVAEETVMPRGEFQGIIGTFLGELTSIISVQFAPGLTGIIDRYG